MLFTFLVPVFLSLSILSLLSFLVNSISYSYHVFYNKYTMNLVLSKSLDQYLLFSLPVWLLACYRWKIPKEKIIKSFLLVLICFEIGSLITFIFHYTEIIPRNFLEFYPVSVDIQFFYLLFPLYPILLGLIFLLVFFMPYFKRSHGLKDYLQSFQIHTIYDGPLLLFIPVLTTFFLSIWVPYLSFHTIFGIDVKYFDLVERVNFSEPRFLTLFLFKGLKALGCDVALQSLLVLWISTNLFLFANLRFAKNMNLNSNLVALFSVFSCQVLAVVFTGTYPFFFSLSFVLFALSELVKGNDMKGWSVLLFTILTFLFHVWTGMILLLALLIWAARSKSALRYLLLSPLILGICLIGSGFWTIDIEALLRQLFSFEGSNRSLNMLHYWIGGVMVNPILFLFSALGVIVLLVNKKCVAFHSWLLVTSFFALITLFGSSLNWRFVFLIPFPILCASGVDFVSQKLEKISSLLFQSLVVLLFFNFFLRSLAWVRIAWV